ncbi:lysophospholipase 3 [Trichomonascus vanleenenianus]|uniref:lysophospholipase n=1 Tax=Trichomonascus vanleenenianus TaxID=2268995 RepID=UPI003ECA50C9
MFPFAIFFALLVSWAVAWSPTNSYAPGNVSCPKVDTFVRAASDISDSEKSWVQSRQQVIKPALLDFFNRANLTDFDVNTFFSNTTSNIALAFSGGGYRAMLCGAGQFAALDNRTINSTNSGHLGGLVQASTYFAGLSGGNWFLNSIVLNNFTSVQALQGSKDLWDLEHSIVNPGGADIFSTAKYWDDIKDDVESKEDAGFNTSITDIWGRGLSQQFIGLDEGGPAMSWSDIQNFPGFLNHSMPFPIVVADGREPNTTIIALNSTVFEFNPYELGSWDPSLYAFTDLEYIGTNVSNGKPTGDQCVRGFDQAGFVLGTSSSLFNQFILQLNSTGVSGVVYDLAEDILKKLGQDNDDIAIYAPNPFKDTTFGNSSIEQAEWLTLVDGGEDNQNIPLYPLIQPERQVDVIFAFDNSADTTYSWPNGSSMVNSYERQFEAASNNTIFPYVPDTTTFINQGLIERPTFFGCNGSNLTSLLADKHLNTSDEFYIPPLIVYVANYAHSFFSNTSTFKMSYSTEEVAGMIQNGYNVVTRQNSTLDSDWPSCVACAIIQREVERRGQTPTAQCQQCFQKYCWDGTTDDSAVNTTGPGFAPTLSVKGNSASKVPMAASAIILALVASVVVL